MEDLLFGFAAHPAVIDDEQISAETVGWVRTNDGILRCHYRRRMLMAFTAAIFGLNRPHVTLSFGVKKRNRF